MLFQGTTESLATEAANYVWELSVPYSEYDIVEKEHVIISSRREKNNVVFRIIAETLPNEHAVAVQPTIEDGYMAVINGVMG